MGNTYRRARIALSITLALVGVTAILVPVTTSPSGAVGDPWFALIAVGWVGVWFVLPPIIGVRLATRHGMPRGMTGLICFFLGWIGVAIVYVLAERRETHPSAEPVEDRLSQLEDLYRRGVIDDAERDARRRAILTSL